MGAPSTHRRLVSAILFVAVAALAVLVSAGVAFATPSISFVTPWGFIGEMITIHGSGLGNTQGRVVFEPGGLEATVIAWMPDGDHSLTPRKASGHTAAEHLQTAAGLVGEFVRSLA